MKLLEVLEKNHILYSKNLVLSKKIKRNWLGEPVIRIVLRRLMGINVESRLSEMLPAKLGELSALERKVSTYLLKHEDKLMEMDISQIAEAADVSKATVVRFCKALGFNGLKDFKIYYLAGKSQYDAKIARLGKDLSEKEVMNTMKTSYIRTIEKSYTDENLEALEGMYEDVLDSKSALVLYSDNYPTAQLLSDRLSLLGLDVKLLSYAESAKNDVSADVVFIISSTGELEGIGNYIKHLRENGSSVELFTAFSKSWLSHNANNTISVFNERIVSEERYILANFAYIAFIDTLFAMLNVNKDLLVK